MKNFEEIVPLATAVVIAIVLFFGFITAVKKAVNKPVKRSTLDSSTARRDQKILMEDVRRRQKQLMRDQRQKIRDLQRK